MVKSPTPFLQHVKDAIDLIQSYIANQTLEEFQSDTKTHIESIRLKTK